MEEIEELRAKAIASMPFSTNPNKSSWTAGAISGAAGRFKYPTGEDLELATCSVAPTNSTNLGESVSHRLKNNATNAARSGTQGMQLRPSAVQNYQMQYKNHFKRKLPFRPRSSQPLHWHAKESNNDLVISFSDDDSGSESEERHPEKDIERMDSTSIAHDSRFAVSLLSKSTDGIEREPDGSKPMPKKGFVNHETISSAEGAHETSYVPQEPDAENHSHPNSQNAAIKTSVGCVPGSTMSDQRLELLHHRIAARENELTMQNRSDPQKGVTVGSDSDLPCLHDMKDEAQAAGIGRHAYDANLEVEVNEPSQKRLKHDKSFNAFDFDVPSKPDNDRTFHVGNSCTLYEPDSNNTVQSTVIKSKDSFLALPAANLRDKPLSENIDVAKNVRSDEFSKKDGATDLPSNYGSSMHTIMGNQQLIPTSDALMPLKTFSIFQKSSGYGRVVNNEANSTEEESMSFDSLVKLEELHDKELEEAQEYRRDCEVEERHALKAYRKAQRSLVEANERCTYLYAKRELFSAKFRSFVMKAPNSIPSDWLGQQIPYEDALDQLHELDSSALVLRDNTPLDETVLPICNPNKSMNNDGEDSPSSDRVVKTRSDHVDVEIEKAPSFDNVQDYELLEASLRSELVARLGLRTSSKMNDINKGENNAEKRAGSIAEDMEPSPLQHDMMPTSDAKQTAKLDGSIAEDMEPSPLPHDMIRISDAKQTAKLDGMERTQERSCHPDASLDFKSLPNASSNEELRCVADLGTNNSFQENSDGPTTPEAFFSLPTSGLHSVSRHTYMIFPGYHSDTCNVKESDNIVTLKEIKVTDFIADNVGEVPKFKRPAPMGYCGTYESSVEIDPFWPLCMFEFRGKCNDEECPWQHMRATMFSKSQDDKHSNCLSTRLLNGKLDGHILPIPTYQIGPYVIKADSHQTHSVLARSNWQYQRRGFCASFLIPFSVQRILPLDAPCLRSGDDPVADDYSWNRLSLYCRSWDDILSFKEQIKQGSVDVEQLLEMALDLFDGDLCELSRREAILKNFQTLSLLSQAIELYPSSVVLWVVFLHIYYKKKAITKDDMFLHAVRHNKDSYELWLLYINSRILLDDRSNAYDQALNALCAMGSRDGRNHLSPYILDIFLQMIDFLHMSGFVDKVISRLCGLLPSIEFDERNRHSLRNICKCLTVPDRCLFWTSCIYFLLYEKLPEAVMQQFEFAKNLPFELEWPCVQLASERKALALDLMQLAMKEVASYLDDHPDEIDQDSSQSLHFLAASHVKCEAALLGFHACTKLLDEYLESYPSCLELVLMALRSIQNFGTDLAFSAFEEALNGWPKEKPGIQCLWNQYAAHALTNDRIDSAETIMARWYQEFPKFRDLSSFCSTTATKSLDFDSSLHTNSTCGGPQSKTKDDAFGYLNFFLYCMLHKNAADARLAIDKSLELAAPDDYLHFVKEHTLFTAASENTESPKHFSLQGLPSLLNHYLYDTRANLDSEPLSRRFIKAIKKPRIQHLVTKILGPVSRSSTLLNSVLRLCYGPSLLPETSENFKETVNFVEFLMEIIPTNHELALSVYKICIRNSVLTHSDSNSVRFWACSLLINSIFQSSPPEHIWLEAADVLKNSESSEINLWFHKQAVSIHPFSVKLWQSYADLSGDVAGEIIEAARERGIELNDVMK